MRICHGGILLTGHDDDIDNFYDDYYDDDDDDIDDCDDDDDADDRQRFEDGAAHFHIFQS